MRMRVIKNILAFLGFSWTAWCIVALPNMCKWFLSLYIVYLVAIWLGHNENE